MSERVGKAGTKVGKVVVEPCCGGVTRAVDAVAAEPDRKGTVAVEKYVTGWMNTGLGGALRGRRALHREIVRGRRDGRADGGEDVGGIHLRRRTELPANCLRNRPGGQLRHQQELGDAGEVAVVERG